MSQNLSSRVRMLREVACLSAFSLAQRAGVMEIAVTFFERGELDKVSIAEAHQIVHGLDLDPYSETIQELRKSINGMDQSVWAPLEFATVPSGRHFVTR